MPPPFRRLDLTGFAELLDTWAAKDARRAVVEVHMHHTWRPNHAQFRGHDSILGMWRRHTQTNGWSDIAQHITIDPDGGIWTGRHWDQPPASSSGHNGTHSRGPFMFVMVGDFDEGRDPFDGAQKKAALGVVALVQDAFDLPVESLKFHRRLGAPKTCPGTAIGYEETLAAVRALRGGGALPRSARGGAAAGRRARGAADPLADERARVLAPPPPAPPEDPGAEPAEEHEEAAHDHAHGRGHGAARGGADGDDALDAGELTRLRPHVVNLWGGHYSRRGQFRTDASDVEAMFDEHLARRVADLGPGERLPVLLYAHGGLVPEAAGLRMAAAQSPWWRTNDVWPIHFVWETGALETIARLLGAQRGLAAARAEPAAAARGLLDPAVEALVRAAGGPEIWAGMKFGAAAAFAPGGDGLHVVARLAAFLKAHPGRFALHAVGHSAGSIFHAYLIPSLLAALREQGVGQGFEALYLMAPAITVEDYRRRLQPLLDQGIGRLAMFTMKKDEELADTVTFAYRKSLLYLISAALEPERDTPILGLEESVRMDAELRRHFGLAGPPTVPAEVVWSPTTAATGASASRSTTHGGFDNDRATMESILRRMRGLTDAQVPDAPFPAEVIAARAAAAAAAADRTAAAAAAGARLDAKAADPPHPTKDATMEPSDDMRGAGRRRALCVGIDAYPDPRARLYGCVADAREWERALAGLGFEVRRLHDAQATRKGIVEALRRLLDEARPGDQLAFQFAGHGMQLDDADAEAGEGDAKDEAICPYDYAEGRLVVDDDLAALFRRLNAGIHLTCFFDCCHSGTVTRFAVGRTERPEDARPRFLPPTPEIQRLHRAFRDSAPDLLGEGASSARGAEDAPGGGVGRRGFGLDAAGAAAGRGRSMPADMRQVVFAACMPHEVALESGGRGDFSTRAVPLLARHAGRGTNAAFQRLVTDAFGRAPRQHPNLDCTPDAQAAPFLAGLAGDGGRGDDRPGPGGDQGDAGTGPRPHGPAAPGGQVPRDAVADLLHAVSRLLR